MRLSVDMVCLWSRSSLSGTSQIKRCNKKRVRTSERQDTVYASSLCCEYLMTACVCWRSLLSPHPWLKLAWPTLLPKGAQTAVTPPSSSVSDMHSGNLCAPFPLPDMNSVAALSPNTSPHTWLRPLSTFPPCNYGRRSFFPLGVHVRSHMHSCLQKAVFFQWFPRLNLTGMLAAPWVASKLWVFFLPSQFIKE